MNPFRYRPTDDDLDWEDNAVSNLLAWLSDSFAPNACTDDFDHWSVRVFNYLYAECGCCLFWRGAAFGVAFATVFFGVILAIV